MNPIIEFRNFSMKCSFWVLVFVVTQPMWAGPKEDYSANAKVRKYATALIVQGKADDAVKYVQQNRVSVAKGDDRTIEVANDLLIVSAELFNERRIAFSKSAALEAIALSRDVRQRQNGNPHLAELLCSAGFVSEHLFHDPDAALQYYTDAVAITPGNRQAVERLHQVKQALVERSLTVRK